MAHRKSGDDQSDRNGSGEGGYPLGGLELDQIELALRTGSRAVEILHLADGAKPDGNRIFANRRAKRFRLGQLQSLQ
jgi:hypothetical protein